MKMTWTKCCDTMPQEGKLVLVTLDIEGEDRVLDTAYEVGGKWKSKQIERLEEENADVEVVAWMPLPEPFEGGNSNWPITVNPSDLYAEAMETLGWAGDEAKRSAPWLVDQLLDATRSFLLMAQAIEAGCVWNEEKSGKDW